MISADRRALTRLITEIEAGVTTIDDLDLKGPSSTRIGITGPPGAGKSTLVNALIDVLRDRGLNVGVLAVDPSSPLTGGALLGDRIRMQAHIDDDSVFIRSMATRGHLGGLAETTAPVLEVMSHSGFDVVLVETVGVGQSEVEVMDLVDQVVLVLTPGWGDQIQADKAGIVEIADVYVINKADRPGADEVERALRQSVAADKPIVRATATTGRGVDEVAALLLSGA